MHEDAARSPSVAVAGSPALRYEVNDGIAEIVLERSPVNAIVESMIDELLSAYARAAVDDAVRVVILRSAIAGQFCAGLDLKELAGRRNEDLHDLVEKLYVRMSEAQSRLGKPSIAVVEGAARGGGMTLAILCDLLVADQHASFGYPEIDVGVLPAIHFAHLPRIVGRHRAFELLFTARTFGAEEAHRIGLVNRVCAAGRALCEARALASTLAGKPPLAMRRGRTAFHREFEAGLHEAAAAAVVTFSSVAATEEAQQAIASFSNRRKRNRA